MNRQWKRFDKDRWDSNKTLRLKRCMGPIRGYAIMSASPLGSVGSIHANGHGINGDNRPSRTPTDGTKCKQRTFPAASWRRRCRHGASCYKWNGRRHISHGLDVCFEWKWIITIKRWGRRIMSSVVNQELRRRFIADGLQYYYLFRFSWNGAQLNWRLDTGSSTFRAKVEALRLSGSVNT